MMDLLLMKVIHLQAVLIVHCGEWSLIGTFFIVGLLHRCLDRSTTDSFDFLPSSGQ